MTKKKKKGASKKVQLLCLIAAVAAVMLFVSVCIPLVNYYGKLSGDVTTNGFDMISAWFFNPDAENAGDTFGNMSAGAQSASLRFFQVEAEQGTATALVIFVLVAMVAAVAEIGLAVMSFLKASYAKYLTFSGIFAAVAGIGVFVCGLVIGGSLATTVGGSVVTKVTAQIGCYLALAGGLIAGVAPFVVKR